LQTGSRNERLCSNGSLKLRDQAAARIRDDGRLLTVWKQEADGVWRIAQTMWNSIRPIGSGTSRYRCFRYQMLLSRSRLRNLDGE
jgi:hypothetical protein